jgi:hypothetical protein
LVDIRAVNDLVYLSLAAVLFLVALAFVRACEALKDG